MLNGDLMAALQTGRPRGFDEAELLESALELFWSKGFRATTTRDLESRLGISQSSLYNAFGSKSGLLGAALDLYEGRIEAELLAPLEASTDGLAAIDRFLTDLDRWISTGGKRGCMVVNLMAEDGGSSGTITTRTRGYRTRVRKALRDALRRSAGAGEIEANHLVERTEVIFGMVLALNIATRGGATRRELRRLLDGARYQVASWKIARH